MQHALASSTRSSAPWTSFAGCSMAGEPPGEAAGCARHPISRSASIAWIATSHLLREQGRPSVYERYFPVKVESLFLSAMFARSERKHMNRGDRMDVPLHKARVATTHYARIALP